MATAYLTQTNDVSMSVDAFKALENALDLAEFYVDDQNERWGIEGGIDYDIIMKAMVVVKNVREKFQDSFIRYSKPINEVR